MGTDYSVLATQSAGGTPGAGYANQIKDNQEALIHPPSARWVCVGEIISQDGSETDPLTAVTYGKVNFAAPKHGNLADATQASQTWQDDVSSTTADSSPFVDSTNNTYSGTSILVGADMLDITNSFKVPKAGIYLINASIGTLDNLGGSGHLRMAIALNGSRIVTDAIAFAPSASGLTRLSMSVMWDLSTSDYFDVQAYTSQSSITVDRGHLEIVRVSEAAD